MNKVNIVFVVLILITISSCTYTKGIAVVNVTDRPIEVKITFNNSNISPISFVVSENSNDVLMYDVNSRSSDFISMGLYEIILDDKSCTTHISRNEVEEKIKKNGLWKLVIDDEILDCHLTN